MSRIRNILYTCVSASVIMTGTVFNTLADENSKSLHFEITGGLGTAEVVTDNGISYSVEGGDDLFHFIPDTELKITIHSKYGIDSIKENNSVLKQKKYKNGRYQKEGLFIYV